MPETIITIYCFFDELLKAIGYQDDTQAQLTTAEIMTIATVAAERFTGNQQKALDLLTSHGYIKSFSKSRFNRRLHRIPESLWQLALYAMAQIHQCANTDRLHIVDTFPLPVCRNIRIKRCRIYRCRIYRDEAFRGYCASKKEYYFGLKVCVIVAQDGAPVELLLAPASTVLPWNFCLPRPLRCSRGTSACPGLYGAPVELLLAPASTVLPWNFCLPRPLRCSRGTSACPGLYGAPVELLLAPASTADVVALRSMDLNLPEESTLIGDTGFLDRELEISLREDAAINLIVPRRKNMKDQLDVCLQYICSFHRKRVENTFSLLAERLARSVHAVTKKGFELKAFLTVLAFTITS